MAVVRQGENHDVFIISQQSERQLTTMFAAKAWAGMVSGPVLTVVGLAYWLSFLAHR